MSLRSIFKVFGWHYPKQCWETQVAGIAAQAPYSPLSGSDSPLISVVVPAFNEEEHLPNCLESLLRQKTETPYEIIVVDNASSDGTSRVAAAMPVRLIREEHRGLTHARQAGLEGARGKLVAYLDADSIAPPRWIESLAEAYREAPDAVGYRGPYRLVLKSGWQKFLFELYFNIVVEFFYGLCLRGPIIAGTNFAVPKTVLEKIGGFNLSIEFYGEDMDLAKRLKRIGKIQFFDSVVLSSGRRFDHKGLLKPAFYYLGNYLWLMLGKKPFSDHYDQAEGSGLYQQEEPRLAEKKPAAS